MLSIGVMAQGQSAYYLGLAREDYYLGGGEPPGVWHGRGAEALGLTGQVSGEQLTRLFEGFHPSQERALVNIQEGKGHRPGWDLTFSAPKSVSVLWSQSDDATRRIIQDAHAQAVKAALDYLESTCPVARRGKGGEHQEKGSLIFATFEHGTSRAQDPQLHTHALFMNAVLRDDGSFGTVNAQSVFKEKMTAGALYRAEFASVLEKVLGVELERREIAFEVAGVPKSLCDEFSKRRAEIEKVLAEKGMGSAEAAAIAALATRSTKEYTPRSELMESWQAIGRAFGWSPEAVFDRPPHQRLDPEQARAQALGEATGKVTEQQSHFSERDFTRRLAEAAPGRGMGAGEVIESARGYLKSSPEIVSLGKLRGEALYTTREMMVLEERIFEALERSKSAPSTVVGETVLKGIIESRQQFSPEQAAALRHIAQEEGGSIRVVSGMAGTGKTTLLQSARLAWELEGYEVLGAALSGKAAKGLAEGAGIESRTIHKTLSDIERGRLTLSAKSVLVIDEAGMVGTRQFAALLDATEKSGATLIPVGDRRQLQPIEVGGIFSEMQKRLGASELTEIRRQREPWARDAVRDFAFGRAEEGLGAYAQRGLFHIAEDTPGARAALIEQWKVGGIHAPEDQLILTGTRLDAAILNRMAQAERQRAGVLGEESVLVKGDRFHVGDQILFTRKSTPIGVVNGSLGKVVGLDAERFRLTVRLDDASLVRFSTRDYDQVQLGYAMTSHKGQGVTQERVFLLAGGSMQDREITYVQMSRAKGDTHIFADLETAGEGLGRLVRQMNESRAKETAHAVAQRARAEEDLRPRNEGTRQHSQTIDF